MFYCLFLVFLAGFTGPVNQSFTPELSPDHHVIELRTRDIDVYQEHCLDLSGMDTHESVRFLVHFPGVCSNESTSLLESRGLKVEGYLAQGGYLVYGPPAAGQGLFDKGYIDWFGAYKPSDKVDPSLYSMSEERDLIVMLFPDVDPDYVASLLTEIGADIERISSYENTGKLLVSFSYDKVADAAAIDGVRWIEPYYEAEFDNAQAQWVIQTWSPDSRRIWDMGIKGQGVIGSTGDSGVRTDHFMFADSNITISEFGDYPDHRKITAYKPGDVGALFGDEISSDHGTHTGGTVCGDDSYMGGQSPHDGMAPSSRLYFVDLFGGGSQLTIPLDYRTMYQLPQEGNEAGEAKFMSNSWSRGFGYNSHAWESDQFSWEHPGFLLIGTAGNNGSTIGAPKTSKSYLTVGATGNGGAAAGVAGFSNPGPAGDGRVKPTVVAPGVDVYSADGAGISDYKPLSGTSMACPAVAGGVALLTQYIREGWYPTGQANPDDGFEPSSALLKAMIVSSNLFDFTGMDIMSGKVGWGRICLDTVMYFAGDGRKLYLDDHVTGISTGDQVVYEMGMLSDESSLRIALVWTDYPPEMGADKQLVNNLDLEVRSPTGRVYLGNNFSSNYSDDGGEADNTNVVELVKIRRPAAGTWTITVKGQEIPQGPQPFALVVIGDIEYHDINLVADELDIDDRQSGNSSGGLDPGETATVYPSIANSGTWDALGVSGKMSSDTRGITIFTDESSYGDVEAGQVSAGDGFTLTASSSLPDDEEIMFTLNVATADSGYVKTLTYPLIIGLGVTESPSSAASLEITRSPFAEHISVRFSIPNSGPVRLDAYDASGRLVKTLLNESNHQSGSTEYTFAAVDSKGLHIPRGPYFFVLSWKEGEADKKLTARGFVYY